MANAALFWVNSLVGASLAASAETADGPVGNLVKPQVVTAWRALGTAASFTADLGAVRDIRFLALLGVTLGAGATLQLRLSSSGAHAGDVYDSGVVAANAATLLDGRKQCLHLPPALQSARYAKVDLADAAAAFIDVGYAWLGDWWQPARNFSWGFADAVRSRSNKEPSLGGQLYTLKRPKARVKSFALDFLTPAEAKAQGIEIADKAGDHAPFGIIPDPAASDATREMVIGTLSDLGTVTGVALNVRARPFELTELL
jgi:hypothetical protein